MECKLYDLKYFLSTNLNSKINSYNRLTDRILRQLGAPTVTVELSRDSIYENISIASELYTAYAGMTKEFLVFHSSLYEKGKGIRLDELFSVRDGMNIKKGDDGKLYNDDPGNHNVARDISFNSDIKLPENVYTCIKLIPVEDYPDPTLKDIKGFENGIVPGKIINKQLYDMLIDMTTGNPDLSANFLASNTENITVAGEEPENPLNVINNAFDYDIMDYRKVNAVTGFDMGESTGINTLFTIEQTLAQQTFYSYSMGNYGFDLISWYTLKTWLDTREKMLSINPTYTFNPRTQILTMVPEPKNNSSQYWGVVSCSVEMPLRDVIKSQWVMMYAIALSKITLANIRGKFGNMTLFGGGSLQYNELMSQGITEKERLEKELFEGTTPGFGQDDGSISSAFLVG